MPEIGAQAIPQGEKNVDRSLECYRANGKERLKGVFSLRLPIWQNRVPFSGVRWLAEGGFVEEQSGLWADPEAALRPGPEEYYRRLITALEDERHPEQLASLWLRRLLRLLPPDEQLLLALIREEVRELDVRCTHLADRVEWARGQLHVMGAEADEQPEATEIEPSGEAGWHAWLAQSPVGYKRHPLNEVARDEQGFPVERLDQLGAAAEQEATDEVVFWINRILAVAPSHVPTLKPLLVNVRRQLSERNEKLSEIFPFL